MTKYINLKSFAIVFLLLSLLLFSSTSTFAESLYEKNIQSTHEQAINNVKQELIADENISADAETHLTTFETAEGISMVALVAIEKVDNAVATTNYNPYALNGGTVDAELVEATAYIPMVELPDGTMINEFILEDLLALGANSAYSSTYVNTGWESMNDYNSRFGVTLYVTGSYYRYVPVPVITFRGIRPMEVSVKYTNSGSSTVSKITGYLYCDGTVADFPECMEDNYDFSQGWYSNWTVTASRSNPSTGVAYTSTSGALSSGLCLTIAGPTGSVVLGGSFVINGTTYSCDEIFIE